MKAGRVRVTGNPADRPASGASLPVQDSGTVYSRGLVRAQLRLALGSLLAFVVSLGALTAVIAVLPSVADPVLFGVPLSWLLLAYGFYPVIAVAAGLTVRSATRNEQRYRALLDEEPPA